MGIFDKNGQKVLLALAVLALVPAIGLFALTASYQSAAQTPVQATIVETNSEPDPDYDYAFELHVTYEYEYEGKTYESNNIYPLQEEMSGLSESELQEAKQTYAEGTNVTAYIDAENPGTARLKESNAPGAGADAIIPLVFGLVLMGLFVVRALT